MKVSVISFIAVAALCGHFAACSRPSVAYTEDDVRRFVLPGTSRNAIVERFGKPIHVEKNLKFEDGTEMDEVLFFDLPPPNPPKNENWAFSGFQVWLKDEKAVRWLASHRDIRVGP